MSAILSLPLAPSVEFDADLIRKFDKLGPRYTSYPTADRFSSGFDYHAYLETCAGVRQRPRRKPFSLYVHIPFCDTVCFYCGCNKVVTKNREKAAVYLDYLKREITMQGHLLEGVNMVEQLHFGGGTPTYLSDAQLDDLLAHLRQWFTFAPDKQGEYSIEVDPRSVTPERISRLRQQGFNRLSLGVQDFDEAVQKAVNRVQPEQQTLDIISAARAAGFRSISIDLIYGLPLQTLASMDATISKVIAADPDRISIYNYAHMPHLFKLQRLIKEADLPSADIKLDMMALCIQRLCAAGYVYIGMDHFAKQSDDLALAQRQGRLQRNFQGYSTHAETDLVSFGVSAIGALGATYSQNEKTLDAYYAQIDLERLPIARGLQLDTDDILRRKIIQMLMCHFEVSIEALEQAFPISFEVYFADELTRLHSLAADGLLEVDAKWISVTPRGRLLIRNICMVFDEFLKQTPVPVIGAPLRYSRTI